MNTVHTIDILNSISENVTAHIKYTNCGGCAVFAALVGRRLSKYVPVEILVQDWRRNNFSNINGIKQQNDVTQFNTTYDWDLAGLDISHVVLKVKIGNKWQVFDADGLRSFTEDDFCEGSLTIEEIWKTAASPAGWNDVFNRKQIPKMARIIRDAFKDPVALQ